MKVIPMEKSELTLPEVLKLAKQQTVVLTRKGKPLASINDLSGSDWEAVTLANSPQFQRLIDASRRSYADAGGTTLESLREKLGLKPTPRPRRRRPRKY